MTATTSDSIALSGVPVLKRLLDPTAVPVWIVTVLLAHAPLLGLHFVGLYRYRPHYEFAPFLVGAAAYLIWRRWPQADIRCSRPTRVAGYVLFALGLLILTIATALFSPFAAAAAAMFCLAGLILLFAGDTAWREHLPVWLLLWLAIPPPFMLEQPLSAALQNATSLFSSSVLDYCGVLHMRIGNIFELPSQTLFVAEACSGIHSQLTLLAATSLLCVCVRRSALHTIALLAAAVFWSLAANTVRVTLIVATTARGWDLAQGWPHEMVGYGLFALAFLAVLSTDQLLMGVFGPVNSDELAASCAYVEECTLLPPAVRIDSRVFAIWNRFVAGWHPPAEQSDARPLSSAREGSSPPWLVRRPQFQVLMAVLACLFVGQSLAIAAISPPSSWMTNDSTMLFQRIVETTLPARLGEWERIGHETETRSEDSSLGHFSHIWFYRRGEDQLNYSMDFPFSGWHELPDCYRAQDWRLDERRVARDEQGQPYAVAVLSRAASEYAILCFSLHDEHGRTLDPELNLSSTWKSRFQTSPLLSLLRSERLLPPDGRTVQFQQFQSVVFAPGSADIAAACRGFETARRVWSEAVQIGADRHE